MGGDGDIKMFLMREQPSILILEIWQIRKAKQIKFQDTAKAVYLPIHPCKQKQESYSKE